VGVVVTLVDPDTTVAVSFTLAPTAAEVGAATSVVVLVVAPAVLTVTVSAEDVLVL
jgi:hypothetical protein